MPLEDFKRVLRKEKKDNLVFSFENSNFFSNYKLIVKDDPNLKEYFGDFLLEKAKVFGFGIKKGRIKFLGEEEVGSYFWKTLKEIFEESKNYKKVTVPERIIEGRHYSGYGKVYIERACGLSVENGSFVVVDKDYLDYLDSVGYDGMRLLENSKLIQFTRDNKTIATLGLVATSSDLDVILDTEEDIVNCFNRAKV